MSPQHNAERDSAVARTGPTHKSLRPRRPVTRGEAPRDCDRAIAPVADSPDLAGHRFKRSSRRRGRRSAWSSMLEPTSSGDTRARGARSEVAFWR